MFYDDAGFLSAKVLVLDFILETFKGLSLLQSHSETRGRDSVTRARAERRQTDVSLSPGCSQSTSHSPHGPFDAETVICMTWHHDIMTLVTFPLVYCDTWHMWRDKIYVLVTPSLRGNVIAHLSSTKHFNKNSSALFLSLAVTSVKLYFPWVDTKYEFGQKIQWTF